MQIIVWQDKHSTNYYDASTLEAWDASAIEILKDLTDEQYGYLRRLSEDDIYLSDEQKQLLEVNLDELPEVARTALERKVNSAKKSLARQQYEIEDNNKQYDLARSYVEAGKSPTYTSPNGRHTYPMSWRILQDRAGYEYENFSLEDVFTIADKEESK